MDNWTIRQGARQTPAIKLISNHVEKVFATQLNPHRRVKILGQNADLRTVQVTNYGLCGAPEGTETPILIPYLSVYSLDEYGFANEGGPQPGQDALVTDTTPGNPLIYGQPDLSQTNPYMTSVVSGGGVGLSQYGTYPFGVVIPLGHASKVKKKPKLQILAGEGIKFGTSSNGIDPPGGAPTDANSDPKYLTVDLSAFGALKINDTNGLEVLVDGTSVDVNHAGQLEAILPTTYTTGRAEYIAGNGIALENESVSLPNGSIQEDTAIYVEVASVAGQPQSGLCLDAVDPSTTGGSTMEASAASGLHGALRINLWHAAGGTSAGGTGGTVVGRFPWYMPSQYRPVYSQGVQARLDGESAENNPHDLSTYRAWWHVGWKMATSAQVDTLEEIVPVIGLGGSSAGGASAGGAQTTQDVPCIGGPRGGGLQIDAGNGNQLALYLAANSALAFAGTDGEQLVTTVDEGVKLDSLGLSLKLCTLSGLQVDTCGLSANVDGVTMFIHPEGLHAISGGYAAGPGILISGETISASPDMTTVGFNSRGELCTIDNDAGYCLDKSVAPPDCSVKPTGDAAGAFGTDQVFTFGFGDGETHVIEPPYQDLVDHHALVQDLSALSGQISAWYGLQYRRIGSSTWGPIYNIGHSMNTFGGWDSFAGSIFPQPYHGAWGVVVDSEPEEIIPLIAARRVVRAVTHDFTFPSDGDWYVWQEVPLVEPPEFPISPIPLIKPLTQGKMYGDPNPIMSPCGPPASPDYTQTFVCSPRGGICPNITLQIAELTWDNYETPTSPSDTNVTHLHARAQGAYVDQTANSYAIAYGIQYLLRGATTWGPIYGSGTAAPIAFGQAANSPAGWGDPLGYSMGVVVPDETSLASIIVARRLVRATSVIEPPWGFGPVPQSEFYVWKDIPLAGGAYPLALSGVSGQIYWDNNAFTGPCGSSAAPDTTQNPCNAGSPEQLGASSLDFDTCHRLKLDPAKLGYNDTGQIKVVQPSGDPITGLVGSFPLVTETFGSTGTVAIDTTTSGTNNYIGWDGTEFIWLDPVYNLEGGLGVNVSHNTDGTDTVTWYDPTNLLLNPMHAPGDLVIGGPPISAVRLPVGASDQVLTVGDDGHLVWKGDDDTTDGGGSLPPDASDVNHINGLFTTVDINGAGTVTVTTDTGTNTVTVSQDAFSGTLGVNHLSTDLVTLDAGDIALQTALDGHLVITRHPSSGTDPTIYRFDVPHIGYVSGDLDVTGSLVINGDLDMGDVPFSLSAFRLSLVPGSGLGIGSYAYVYTYTTTSGGETTESSPFYISTVSGDQAVRINLGGVSIPGINGRNIYRTFVDTPGIFDFLTHITGTANSIYIDTAPDSALPSGHRPPTSGTASIGTISGVTINTKDISSSQIGLNHHALRVGGGGGRGPLELLLDGVPIGGGDFDSGTGGPNFVAFDVSPPDSDISPIDVLYQRADGERYTVLMYPIATGGSGPGDFVPGEYIPGG